MKKSTFSMQACAAIAAIAMLNLAPSALAGAHTWDVNEVFSNADGTIQFIELREMNGTPGEIFLQGLQVKSLSTGKIFTFPANLVSPSTNKHILLATQTFANLPGAPVPNHIIPGNFFNPAGDTITYHVYDSWTFGAVPTNCFLSLNRIGGAAGNTPTNYSGGTGQVNGCPEPPACAPDIAPKSGNGTVDVDDLLAVINSWGATGDNAADITDNGVVDVDDLLAVINAWGPCL